MQRTTREGRVVGLSSRGKASTALASRSRMPIIDTPSGTLRDGGTRRALKANKPKLTKNQVSILSHGKGIAGGGH